ncbi:MAG TPA: ATP-binding protein [Fimbriimonas sp.]
MALLSVEALNRVLSAPLPDLAQIRGAASQARGRASALLEHLLAEPQPRDPDWQHELSIAYLRLGYAAQALEHSREAMKVNAEGSNLMILPRTWYVQTLALLNQGIYGGARQLLEQMEAVAVGLDDKSAIGLHHNANGWLLLRSGSYATGEFEKALDEFEKALEIWVELGDSGRQIESTEGIASALHLLGRYFESLEMVDSGLRLAGDVDDWHCTHGLLLSRALSLRDQGYRLAAEEALQLTLDWCAYEGDDYTRARALMGLGEFYATSSDARYFRAEPTLQSAISLCERIGSPVLCMEARMALADFLSQEGQMDRAQEVRTQAVKIAERVANEGTRKYLELRENERKLRDQVRRQRFEKRLREAFEGSLDSMFVFDARRGSDGTVIDLENEVRNSAACELIETPSGLTRMLSELSDHPVFAGLSEEIPAVVDRGTPYSDEINVNLGGEDRWLARRVVPMTDGATLTVHDVTERRSAEILLRETAERAKQADQAKSEFLAHMSHEVRTPITGVLGLARLLSETRLTETQRTYVEGIVSSADLLLEVISDFLDLSKIEAGKFEIEPTIVNVRKLLEDCAKVIRNQAEAKGLSFELSIDDGLPPFILLDGTRFRQITVNLLGNALKFTREGSIALRVFAKDDRFRMEVRDTGVGVAADMTDRIFEAYEQADGTHNQGTGLGLAISKKLVQMMGGCIGVESQVEHGSLFWVELPLEESMGTRPETPATASSTEKPFHGKKALSVEDNRISALVTKTQLAREGLSVDLATDGGQAVAKAKRAYDIVFMDLSLPTIDGFEATRQIRANERGSGRRTPIIGLTAGGLPMGKEKALEAGMDDYLVKPITPQALREVLERWVKKSQ